LSGEQELYALLIRQPEKGLEKIMDRYMAFVYTVVYGKLSGTGTRQDIEECVSDIFYEFYRTRHTIDPEKGSVKAWLAVLSKRMAIDAWRRQRRAAGDLSLDDAGYAWIASEADPEKELADRETGELLMRQIRSLGEPDSQIILRKYYLGQSAKIIAGALKLKENTVNKKASRSLEKLKQTLGGVL